MNKKFLISAILLGLLTFAIPIEHKFDKLFRFFSLTLIPNGLEITEYYDKKIFFYASDIAGFIFLFWSLHSISLKKLFSSPLWIVLLCSSASIIASPFGEYPVAYTRLFQLLTSIALFSFIAHYFSGEEVFKLTRMIFVVLMIAGLCQTGIAIAQYFKQSPLGLRLLSEPKMMSYFNIDHGCRWIWDQIFSRNVSSRAVYRASGTLPHANVLGGFLLISMFATYALAIEPKRRLLALTLPVQFFAMCVSYSRSALFAWILGTALWFGYILVKRIRNWEFLAVMVGISVVVSSALLFNQFLQRGGIVNYNQLAQHSDAIRMLHQNTAFKIIEENPIFGLGYSQFSERVQKYFPPDSSQYARSTAPHNIYLFLACETGLISLGAFLIFIGLLIRSVAKSALNLEIATLFSIFVAFLFIGCCDFYPILFQQGKLMFFLVCGLLAANTKQNITS